MHILYNHTIQTHKIVLYHCYTNRNDFNWNKFSENVLVKTRDFYREKLEKNCFICRSHLTSFKRLKAGVISWLNVFRFWYFKILSQEASSWLLGWKKTNQMDSDEAQASQNKGGLGRMNQMDGAVADCSSNSLEQA